MVKSIELLGTKGAPIIRAVPATPTNSSPNLEVSVG
jgi:hypothetical protein